MKVANPTELGAQPQGEEAPERISINPAMAARLPVEDRRIGDIEYVRADLPRATAATIRKLTPPELSHLLALLEAEKESGEYAGPREQYYARTERLMKWCQEQING